VSLDVTQCVCVSAETRLHGALVLAAKIMRYIQCSLVFDMHQSGTVLNMLLTVVVAAILAILPNSCLCIPFLPTKCADWQGCFCHPFIPVMIV